MMDAVLMKDLEEMTLCSYCKQKFNDVDQVPKLLSCKHYFCLSCIETMLKGYEVFCVNCWKRTELCEKGPETLPTYKPVLQLTLHFPNLKLGPKQQQTTNQDSDRKLNNVVSNENCHRHAMPLALWCHTCNVPICRACANEHAQHLVRSQNEAKEQLLTEVQGEVVAVTKLLQELTRLTSQQRGFLLQVLESCTTLKTHIETDLQNGWSHMPQEITDARQLLARARLLMSQAETPSDAQALYTNFILEKQRLQAKVQDMFFQCQLDELIGSSSVVFDFTLLKQALASIHTVDPNVLNRNNSQAVQNPILFLTNYCMSQLYSRHVLSKQQANAQQNGTIDGYIKQSSPTNYDINSLSLSQSGVTTAVQPVTPFSVRPTNPYPLFYFNIEVNNSPLGRIVIETRPDVAPKMSKNFQVLCTGEMGMSYKGCTVFQCWEGESVITGDFESNNGRGGRSIYEEGYFLPDDTKFPAVRGTVGMRRTQKRHDSLGMVGSQFRIILQEMRGFTGIFGHVVEGIELVEQIASFSDQTGKPSKNVVIVTCGQL